MGYQYYQQICLKGHQKTDCYDGPYLKEYCNECGKELLYKCPKCSEPINGYYSVAGFYDFSRYPSSIPEYCGRCSASFPWNNRTYKFKKVFKKVFKVIFSNAKELILVVKSIVK